MNTETDETITMYAMPKIDMDAAFIDHQLAARAAIMPAAPVPLPEHGRALYRPLTTHSGP